MKNIAEEINLKTEETPKIIRSCPKCKAESCADNAKFCYLCGSPLQTEEEALCAEIKYVKDVLPINAPQAVKGFFSDFYRRLESKLSNKSN